MDTKICGKCKIEKPLEDFAKRGEKHTSKCKQCHNEYYATYWKNTPVYQKHKDRVNRYRSNNKDLIKAQRYGISLDEYILLKEISQELCMICKEYKATAIDHCHASGKVRGLLCQRCNVALGWFEDKAERMQNAIEYLNRNKHTA